MILINIAICEDEKKQQLKIKKMIENLKLSETYELHTFSSGEELIDSYDNDQRFSIILLDMKMNELNGIQTAEIVRRYDKNCVIIIITSILKYAVDGYSIDAFDFILKPVDEVKFSRVILKAVKMVQSFMNQTYVIETREKTAVLKLSDILYLESNGRKVLIHCENEIYENNENITSAEKKLISEGFIRISRYYLVNMKHIKEFSVKRILMSNQIYLNFSNKYCKDVRKKYMQYIMEMMI